MRAMWPNNTSKSFGGHWLSSPEHLEEIIENVIPKVVDSTPLVGVVADVITTCLAVASDARCPG